jgi:hypothetical protein
MGARLFKNVDKEEGQDTSIPVYSEKLDVFKDACNIAAINSKYAKCFTEKMKKMRQEMYHIILKDNPDKNFKVKGISGLVLPYTQVESAN